ncbi:Phosphatidylinositol-3-phosphatase SAC1 [Malassezia equina]|uniref:Phosphatidylinositol-3-phosphatase SAC1 n=1 Tax=Malassezia equina TaxID=1381935 RepID=A0AAF0J2D4_9BASI|nr:Phosphatidylinositol-3-phosphatase SAC1 [Malassezia equina]
MADHRTMTHPLLTAAVVAAGDAMITEEEAIRVVPEYEQRSVFCSELDSHVAQRDLGEFFEEHLGCDTVLDVRIEVDLKTGLTKGIGYVELARPDLVPMAVDLTGKRMFGAPIVVQRAEVAPKNYAVQLYEPPRSAGPSSHAPVSMSAPTGPILPPSHAIPGAPGGPPGSSNPEARLYVGNLHFDIGAPHVRAVFEPFGQIDDVEVNMNPMTGKNKGFAFVQFRRAEEAQQAIEQLNGFELAGRAMKVGLAGARGGGHPDYAAPHESHHEYARDPARQGNKKFALMEKLARNDPDSQAPARPLSIPEAVSSAILLKYMFNPAEETEPNWATDLREDVRDECARHGNVQLVHVDKDSADGEVYVCFSDESQAQSARKSLQGRFFGGKQIEASFIPVAFAKAKAGW